MNNYFGIGIDAKISLDFHHKREEHPEKCRSRAKNYMWYGVLGSKQWLQKTYKNLEQRVQLECDGQRIPLPSLQGIVVLNIPRYIYKYKSKICIKYCYQYSVYFLVSWVAQIFGEAQKKEICFWHLHLMIVY